MDKRYMHQTGYQTFEDLVVWQKSRVLKNEIFKLVKTFPPEEKYRLVDQLIRSSRSINSLIAEGYGKRTIPDKINYCLQARGSLSETLNHLIDAFDCAYIHDEQLISFRRKLAELEKLLSGYISYLQNQIPKNK